MQLSSRDKVRLKNHPYLQEGGCDFMLLGKCKNTYEVIERILLNIAAKNSISWSKLLRTLNFEDGFVELCCAMILINKYLRQIFNIEKGETLCQTGYDFSQLIEEYSHWETNNL